MELYLMRHGEAMSEEEDPRRPLTDAGRAAAERVARRAAAGGLHVDLVQHSGVLRAQQTAEILARELTSGARAEPRQGLRPLDPVEPVARWLLDAAFDAQRAPQRVALVGHLPFLDRLASRLVADDESAQVVVLGAGALVKLVPKRQGVGFAVQWLLEPELV